MATRAAQCQKKPGHGAYDSRAGDTSLMHFCATSVPLRCLPFPWMQNTAGSTTPEHELSPAAAQPRPGNILMYRTAVCSAHWQTQHVQQLLAPTPRLHTLDLRPHASEPLPHAAGAQAVS